MRLFIFVLILMMISLFSGCVENDAGPDNTQRRSGIPLGFNATNRTFDRTRMNMTDGNFSRPPVMDLTEEQISEVTAVFETSDSAQIETYCREEMMGCGYYCRMVNPENVFCRNMNISNFRDREVFQ